MLPDTTTHLAESLAKYDKAVTIIWHGGEPLSCGLKSFSELVQPLIYLEECGKIRHAIQTNATLLNESWCDFFISHQFKVGISIDGPEWANFNRVDWSDKGAFSKTLKGIAYLKNAAIDFHIIAVIGNQSLNRAKELYEFFCELGCTSVGINIEEREGANQSREVCDDSRVTCFWQDLFEAWQAKPMIRIREFDYVISWMNAVCSDQIESKSFARNLDIFPTIGWNGDVVVLSPELLGAKCLYYDNFTIGNINKEPLDRIISRAQSAKYVSDFLNGVRSCKELCPYFSFCGGGQASNKYYELGLTSGTETSYCRNSKIRLVDAVLNNL
jgi:uncharacterized protein